MSDVEPKQDLNYELRQDVVSQFPLLNGYSHGIRGFALADDAATREAAIESLQEAFDKILAAIPWLGQQVANVGSKPGNSGVFKCLPWPTDVPRRDKIIVKDCSDLAPSFPEILAAGAPVSMLDGDILTPWPGLPHPAGISPAPVVGLQANFVKGGLLLSMSFHHNIMDGTAIYQFFHLMETVLNGGEISAEDIEEAHRDRASVIPLYGPDEPIVDHSFLRRSASVFFPPPVCEWRIFRLRISELAGLKKLASDRENGWDPEVSFISSHDALSAFCWSCISSVRLKVNGNTPDQRSKFGRAIDVRRLMGIPNSYMGHMVYQAMTWLPMGTVATAPLPMLACALRKSLDEANTVHNVRSYATWLAREPDKSQLIYAGPWNTNTDVGSTSPVSAMAGYQPAIYGPILGEAKFARRPKGPMVPNTMYFFPPDDHEWMSLQLCFPRAVLDGLEQHAEWSRIMKSVG